MSGLKQPKQGCQELLELLEKYTEYYIATLILLEAIILIFLF